MSHSPGAVSPYYFNDKPPRHILSIQRSLFSAVFDKERTRQKPAAEIDVPSLFFYNFLIEINDGKEIFYETESKL